MGNDPYWWGVVVLIALASLVWGVPVLVVGCKVYLERLEDRRRAKIRARRGRS